VIPAAGRDAPASPPRLAVVGGGPAGLMAAETALASGVAVHLYESRGSVGRKFLVAGRGGLNLTHSEPRPRFDARFGARASALAPWLDAFDGDAIRAWAHELGIETFVGSSGRVFPREMKAAPLLRAWVRRLRERGAIFHVHHRCIGWTPANGGHFLAFDTPDGRVQVDADAVVFALGGASWPQLGSDGAWVDWVGAAGLPIAPLQAANCGFDVGWSAFFAARFAGAPVKPAWLRVDDGGDPTPVQGEFVITAGGIEGSLVYALSARLRDAIARDGEARLLLDLAPARSLDTVAQALARPRKGRSLSEVLRRALGLDGVRAALLREVATADVLADPARLAALLKSLPIRCLRPRPVAEAISTAGGLRLDALDAGLMARSAPGAFFAGEMLDWDAPTGGYLLTASLASGRVAGAAAATFASRAAMLQSACHRPPSD
jgi:uncharacterized flavoprotein (TIGR03862 family)